jgi:hypothetical protein
MAKKQTKADKAFIAKISTLNIGSKSSGSDHEHGPTCGCGKTLEKVGHVKGEFYGKQVEGDVYAHPLPDESPVGENLKARMKSVREKKAREQDEQSFSA